MSDQRDQQNQQGGQGGQQQGGGQKPGQQQPNQKPGQGGQQQAAAVRKTIRRNPGKVVQAHTIQAQIGLMLDRRSKGEQQNR